MPLLLLLFSFFGAGSFVGRFLCRISLAIPLAVRRCLPSVSSRNVQPEGVLPPREIPGQGEGKGGAGRSVTAPAPRTSRGQPDSR